MSDNEPSAWSLPNTHDARSVANFVISYGMKRGAPFTPLQVVKLAYLCHGWMLGLYDRPLSAQPVEAWQYGPVIPDVYHSVKGRGRRGVQRLIDVPGEQFDDREHDIMDQVCRLYGDYSGIELSQMTHAPGTPWEETWNKFGKNAIIPDPLIHSHYKELKARAGDG